MCIRDRLYKGFKIVPYCPRCGTPLSSQEVAQGYKTCLLYTSYLALALVGGWFVERFHGSGLWGALGLVLGTALLYAFGTAWFVVQMEGATIGYALGVCVVPFLVGDAAKIAISSVLGPLLRRRILAAGLLPSKASP